MPALVDVGENGIELGPGKNQITVNPGVREDAVDAFLTNHDLMFKTVTAGGFFSLGGMTSVDVHGGTVDAPIFAETASSFTILGADGNLTTIDATSPSVNGWSPLQFARVSLGGLGIVARMTLDVLPRSYATTLQGGTTRHLFEDKQAFVAEFQKQLTGPAKHTRMEVFYTPYAAAPNVPWLTGQISLCCGGTPLKIRTRKPRIRLLIRKRPVLSRDPTGRFYSSFLRQLLEG